MSARPVTRRGVLCGGLVCAGGFALRAQTLAGVHDPVADMERPHILAHAQAALKAAIVAPGSGDAAEDLRAMSATVALLVAAYVVGGDVKYVVRAGEHVRVWLLDAATARSPSATFGGSLSGGNNTMRVAGIVELVPLAELARASCFLAETSALTAAEHTQLSGWFTAMLRWVTTDPAATLARDRKDHEASAWLLLASALSRGTGDEKTGDLCRRLFYKPTLRNQIDADGKFPQEAATANPYRNTLMNFDLLAGCAQLLTTPFDKPWDDELTDGPGMRAVAAWIFPYIVDRSHWPFPDDAAYFRDLPGRRAGILFAGRAFHRPEYVQAFAAAAASAPPAEIAYSFPITQALLWTARAPHGM